MALIKGSVRYNKINNYTSPEEVNTKRRISGRGHSLSNNKSFKVGVNYQLRNMTRKHNSREIQLQKNREIMNKNIHLPQSKVDLLKLEILKNDIDITVFTELGNITTSVKLEGDNDSGYYCRTWYLYEGVLKRYIMNANKFRRIKEIAKEDEFAQ